MCVGRCRRATWGDQQRPGQKTKHTVFRDAQRLFLGWSIGDDQSQPEISDLKIHIFIYYKNRISLYFPGMLSLISFKRLPPQTVFLGSFYLAWEREVSVLSENAHSRVVKNWKTLMETSRHMRLLKHFSYLYGRSTPETFFVRARDVRNDFSLVKWVVIKMCVSTEILYRHSHSCVNRV